MKIVKSILIISFTFTIAGCSEGNFRPVTKEASEREIVIEYDQSVLSGNRVMKVASDHCAKFGKTAKLEQIWGGGWTLTLTKERWSCN